MAETMGVIIFFVVVVGIPYAIWLFDLNKPICAACGERILEKQYLGVSSPANVKLHDKESCSDKWDEMANQEPYSSRSNEYIEMLDRKRAGEHISKQEWQDFHRRCR